MKKKMISILLLVSMLLPICGIIVLVICNFDVLISVFGGTDIQNALTAGQVYTGIAVLLTCFALLFFIYIRHRNSNMSVYSKTDALTGLGTKKQLYADYSKIIHDRDKYICVAYLGFDAKKIMYKYGILKCESLEKGLADVLRTNCSDDDSIARISDGTFALILSCTDGVKAQQRVTEITDRANGYLFKIFMENTAPIRSGIYLSGIDRVDFETAFENAEIGYKYACENNQNTLICTDELINKQKSRNRLFEKLSVAIDNKEFDMFLQFIYDVKENKFTGAEALSRWNSPKDGFIMPAYYINDMRTTGVIEKFDMYMLDKACSQLEKWSNDSKFKDLLLSCNITRITISSENFVENLRKIAKKYNFNHNQLILEITEDALIDNQTLAFENIVKCKDDGYLIALDDFGAGNSSFSDISNYPVDQIKVDRQFIAKTGTKRGAMLLQGLIQLAHQLDIDVVCEGVETENQANTVVENGCDYIQGYYYSYVFSIDEGKTHFLNSLG